MLAVILEQTSYEVQSLRLIHNKKKAPISLKVIGT
jgi:hypothetical protein